MTLDLSGVHPAHLVPFDETGSEILEDQLQEHVSRLDSIDGINGMVTNGHGAEVFALSPDERVRLVELVDDAVSDSSPVVSGLVAGSTAEAVREGNRLRDAGADAFLLFPPHTSIDHRPEAAKQYIETVASDVGLPIVLFQHPVWAGGTYEPDVLSELASLEAVVAVKEASWDIDRSQKDVEALREHDVDAQYLVANDEHLLASYALRADGSILILAAVFPELIVDLYEAIDDGDLDAARDVYQRLEPVVSRVYDPPLRNSLPRLKRFLELEGRFPNAVPREPALPVQESEVAEIRRLVETATV